MKRYLYILSCVCTLAACSMQDKKTEEAAAVKVETIRMETLQGISVRHYVGTIEEESRIPMNLLTTGMITEILVKNGQHVKQGDILLKVDGQQAKHALQSSEATLRQAEDGYKRIQNLHKEGVVTDVKEIEIQTKLAEAQSMAAAARKALEDCTMRAPRDGVITDIEVQKGQNLAPGQRAMTLLSDGGYKVSFSVPENEIAQIHCGDKGSVEVKAIEQSRISVTITEKSILADRLSHTYEVKAIVDKQKVEGLMPGMVCRVVLQKDLVSGYLVPQQCVQIRPDGPSVWVAENCFASRRAVETGGYVGDNVLILGGLQSGDRVVIEGYQKLYQGCEITEE